MLNDQKVLTNGSVISALIVDDEPLAHQVMLHHLQAVTDIRVIGQCYNATQALQFLASTEVDLLFLDINMPALSGIEMLRVLANKPQVIIVSAYQEYALEGFELDVTDYLLKPVAKARFEAALDKVRARHAASQPSLMSTGTPPAHESVVLKVGREKRKFLLEDIQFLEAYGNYVKLLSSDHQGVKGELDMTLVNTSIKQLLQELPGDNFVQVHKSFVVNRAHIQALNSEQLELRCGEQIKVGKSFKKIANALLEK